jgi:hypothetical protein
MTVGILGPSPFHGEGPLGMIVGILMPSPFHGRDDGASFNFSSGVCSAKSIFERFKLRIRQFFHGLNARLATLRCLTCVALAAAALPPLRPPRCARCCVSCAPRLVCRATAAFLEISFNLNRNRKTVSKTLSLRPPARRHILLLTTDCPRQIQEERRVASQHG